MTLNVEDKIATLDPVQRRKVEDRAAELIAEEMTLTNCARPGSSPKRASRASFKPIKRMESWQTSIKALTVDVFGTVTDWHSTIVREGERLGSDKRIIVDWARFATAWRSGYEPAMGRVRRGELPWTQIDALHRMILDDILQDFSIPELSEDEKQLFQSRLAPTGSVARCGRRHIAIEVQVHRCRAFQWQYVATDQHGEARWYSVGLYLVSRACAALQAGQGSLRDGGASSRFGAVFNPDGRGASPRPSGG